MTRPKHMGAEWDPRTCPPPTEPAAPRGTGLLSEQDTRDNVSALKNLPAMQEPQETQVRSLGWEDPLNEGRATHSSILAWRIPWTEESGELYSPWDLKESDTTGVT